jgi:hypothetical protein
MRPDGDRSTTDCRLSSIATLMLSAAAGTVKLGTRRATTM